ncbi:hypothetical protein WCE14_08690 [Acinetobacter schindleri]|uniref:hypothetical protein n=1 Tax=Acinetobacter schindleri TaxID=108981 RepID=UPI0034D4BA1B
MATLDVSRALLDPKFMSRGIVCTRTAVEDGDNGRPQTTVTTHKFNGVVTTNDGDKLDRRSDGTVIKGAINIHTCFVLSEGDADHQADEIEWQGRKYIVSQVLSNTHYGRGFVKAICILKPISG